MKTIIISDMKKNNSILSARRTMHILPMAWMPAAIACLALFVSCGDLTDNDTGDTPLPGGKYPMAFTAAVDGPAQTRATTDNSWAGGEEVAVQVGSEVKKYTAAAGGNLTATDPFYWQNTKGISVTAWYPYLNQHPTTWTVQADQSGDGYQQSDMLYASQLVRFQSPGLTFKHLPAKVIINLKHGDGPAADDITNATVSIVSQNLTSGNINSGWTMEQAATGSDVITPNKLTGVASGYQLSMQALLVPQQMQGQKFIQVVLNDGTTYYYTPGNSDADLKSGKVYIYAITVKNGNLTATPQTITAWTDNKNGQNITSFIPLQGSGTQADPYRVTSLEDFRKIQYHLEAYYKQTTNIDMKNESFDGVNGTFKGTYDGDNKNISNVNISGKAWYSGLFQLNIGTLKNIKVTGGSAVSNNAYGAVICGHNDETGIIENCSNATTITGNNHNVGGICGGNSALIKNCTNSGDIQMKGTWNEYGGISGINDGGTITGCTNTGFVANGGLNHGPICGSKLGIITNCNPSSQNTN